MTQERPNQALKRTRTTPGAFGGGQLYDDWWKTTLDTEKPKKDYHLWKEQSTNKRSGYDTYRCKECHGWDYRGKNGAYGKGSHYTGFKGVYEAAKKMSIEELENINKRGAQNNHDFTQYIGKEEIADLEFGFPHAYRSV
ncbi:MAG: hypothetical protein K9L59_16155 [Desulfobacterales bacterium]|nr:hypothetical protein [Desulfobacterales bacterium]